MQSRPLCPGDILANNEDGSIYIVSKTGLRELVVTGDVLPLQTAVGCMRLDDFDEITSTEVGRDSTKEDSQETDTPANSP